jgi:hypothetical protein
LMCSVTLFVSTLGVRSYSDQRYSSMQISATRHSLRISTGREISFGCSFVGSETVSRNGRGLGRTAGGDRSQLQADGPFHPVLTWR